MSDRLSKASMSTSVRNYAQGAAQSALGKIANFLAPSVNVASTNFRYWEFDNKNRFRIPQTRRSINGQATQIKLSGTERTATLVPNALDYPIDEFEQLADSELMLTLQEGADVCAQLGGLAHEKEVVDLALSTVGAGTDLSIATSGIDLADELDQRIITVAKAAKAGSLMNIRILWGPNAFRRFKNHSSVKGRFSSGGKKEMVNPTITDIMSLLIGNPESEMALTVYDAAEEGLSEDMNFILDGSVLIFATMANPTRHDPSFMKTFRLSNKFMVPGAYTSQDGRQQVAKFDWYALPKVTNSVAVARLNITT